MKIHWDDGEQVTWRRDSLAGRPIEILEADTTPEEGIPTEPAGAGPAPEEEEVAEKPAADEVAIEPTPEQAIATEVLATEQIVASQDTDVQPAVTPAEASTPAVAEETPNAKPEGGAAEGDATTVTAQHRLPPAEGLASESPRSPRPRAPRCRRGRRSGQRPSRGAQDEEAPPRKAAKPETDGAGAPKLSALDAAAKVLGEAGQPLGCKEMIGAMAAKGYWSSPGGKTPEASLYSAILREITTKGDASRFRKAGPGKFVFHPGTVGPHPAKPFAHEAPTRGLFSFGAVGPTYVVQRDDGLTVRLGGRSYVALGAGGQAPPFQL